MSGIMVCHILCYKERLETSCRKLLRPLSCVGDSVPVASGISKRSENIQSIFAYWASPCSSATPVFPVIAGKIPSVQDVRLCVLPLTGRRCPVPRAGQNPVRLPGCRLIFPWESRTGIRIFALSLKLPVVCAIVLTSDPF